MRVGVWRFFDLYKRLGLRPTLSVNARVCVDYERVAREARDSDWEPMGHAYEQMPIHKIEDQEYARIRHGCRRSCAAQDVYALTALISVRLDLETPCKE